MNFEKLAFCIQQTNELLQQNAVKAVNIHITLRNWLTGFYIVEFEQNGSDRAEYGAKLLENLAKNISIKGLSAPELSRCRQFYHTYPQIFGLITQEFKTILPADFFKDIIIGNAQNRILGSAPQELQNNETNIDLEYISNIFQSISYTHFTELIKIEEPTKRRFYEQFITELGNGFCFEARQKRILIGDEYYFIDLIFYHRILKCHVLIDLKTEAAKHEHIGQLKSYLNYYKRNIQESNDNPPVGILLVTNQNKALVEYAIADSDLDIFVSKYQLQLPDKSQLEAFINNELKNI